MIHQPTTAPIIRQNAITEPVDSDHLMAAELIEKLTTARPTAMNPIDRSRAGLVAGCFG